MKVKVCGITNSEDALFCEKCGANALGFIFYKESKRFIETEEVKEIIGYLSPFTMKVGVFVNQDAYEINLISNKTGLNVVQLHGNEGTGFIRQINLPVIKVFKVNNDFNFDSIKSFNQSTILLDIYSEYAEGGTGQQFDWNLIPVSVKNKIILSGGITIDHLEIIISKIKPLGIDLSSSLEKFPGKKDKQKVLDFFNRLKGLDK